MEALLQRFPGARLGVNAVTALVIWGLLTWVNQVIEPLMSYYLATAAMYATAMFGMTILLGLSGQVSLGNGALMAIGGYVFALTSMNWQTVPLLGTPWNAVWSMVFAGVGGVVFGAAIGGIAARLRGPYLAGLTLGIAVAAGPDRELGGRAAAAHPLRPPTDYRGPPVRARWHRQGQGRQAAGPVRGPRVHKHPHALDDVLSGRRRGRRLRDNGALGVPAGPPCGAPPTSAGIGPRRRRRHGLRAGRPVGGGAGCSRGHAFVGGREAHAAHVHLHRSHVQRQVAALELAEPLHDLPGLDWFVHSFIHSFIHS